MKEGFYFVNVTDNDLDKIKDFSKSIEEEYDIDTLTGLNFAKTKDGNYILGFTFKEKARQEEVLGLAKSIGFKNVYTKEENWAELITLAEMCIVGNFSYKMLHSEEENVLMVNNAVYKKLKKAYEQALEEKKEIFIFEDKEVLTSYAKYLLQYLENRLR